MMEIGVGEANVRCLARSDKWSHLRDTGHPRRIRKFRECSVFLFLRLCENNPSPGPFGERFLVATRSIKNRREHQWPAQSAASTAYVLLCVSCQCRLGWTVYVWSTVSCTAEAAVESLANGKGIQLLCQPIKYQHWSDIDQTQPLSAKLIDSNFKIVVLATDVPS